MLNRYLILDFDSTLVKVEALDELAKKVLENDSERERKVAEIIDITNLGMEGRISFPESLRRRIELISTDRKMIERVARHIANNISDSVLENVDFFKKNCGEIFIISGGFEELIFPTAEMLGIPRENVLANKFVFDEDDCVSSVDQGVFMCQENGKVKQINALNLDKGAVMVGDGWTDCETKECECIEKFIAFTENVHRQKVIEHADFVAKDFGSVIDIMLSE